MPFDETSTKARPVGKPAIAAYGCSSSAGPSVARFWSGLIEGRDHSRETILKNGARVRSCTWERAEGSSRLELLVSELHRAWDEAASALSEGALTRIREGSRLGVILASTKGEIDDWVWEQEREADPLTPVLEGFLKRAGLSPARSLCVSNACASSHSALFLAGRWLKKGEVDEVLVLAADAIGPFVLQGFLSLRALTEERCRPFDAARTGLQLGEAAAAIVLSSREKGPALSGVAIDAEGFAATRPSSSGESLSRACQALQPMLSARRPELIVAHGTATALNDPVEDRVFSALFREKPPITATKGSIGHTLGASGAMDVIAACEAIRHGTAFPIANTRSIDPSFAGNYQRQLSHFPIRRVLISSLGFGGIHAAALIDAGGES